ncbi:hypothetical protein C8F04DRAFT_1186919 [Mycena alexandri]|uniref:Uncharacterized protein n=1 Tax=Mycena alexandri TaxID=1745969 RepID=A0AAD6SN66_9AGAR|nr:hypothetical protein C8F04DRAFT_1186919 [Mycena alexandri]
MDASAIGRFHSTVQPIPLESLDVPAGGLGHFLRQNLRFKVFLVSMSVLEDRWGTRTRNSVTAKELHDLRYYAARLRQNELRANFSRHNTPPQATWMFYLIAVLLYAVGFDGDDAPDMQGVSVFGLALSQAEFFLKECAEAIALYRLTDTPVFFDYQEYDPQHTVEMVFASRQPPRNYKRIAVNDNPVLDFSVKPSGSYWTDAQRVVEATLMALSRIDGALIVEMDSDGSVVGIQKESVEGILADMVESPPARSHTADCLEEGSADSISGSPCPTLCTDEETCGREATEWIVMLSSSELRAIRSDLLLFPV